MMNERMAQSKQDKKRMRSLASLYETQGMDCLPRQRRRRRETRDVLVTIYYVGE